MDQLGDHLPWIIAAGSIMILLLWPRRKQKPIANGNTMMRDQVELGRLKGRVRELEEVYHTHMEFIVNFPEVVRMLTAALSLEQVLSACSRGITAMLQTREIGILLGHDAKHMVLVDGAGYPPEHRGNLKLPLEDLLTVVENRSVSDLVSYGVTHRLLRKHGLPSNLGVPLWYGDKLLGLILVGETKGNMAMTRRILVMLADLTAVGLHAATQVSQIRDDAERDGLTGLANRRTMMQWVEREVQRSRSYGSSISLAMMDVDHFKHYNDKNGHGAGDAVLKDLARLFQGTTRRTDLVARYGGEEFTVVLAGADRDRAWAHAERIRETIANHVFPHGDQQPLGRLTISIGIATFPEDAIDMTNLFEAADRALYQAKEQGRNRVAVYKGAALGEEEVALTGHGG